MLFKNISLLKLLPLFCVASLSFNASAGPEFWNTPHEMSAPLTPSRILTDESINFQPGINLYPEGAKLTDLFGTKGNQLCAPTAITNAINFLKYKRNPAFPNLARIPDMDNDGVEDTYRDQIRYFFQTCQTDREAGTYYQQAIGCMKDFMTVSGYKPWAYIIGPHAQEAPPGYDISSVKVPLAVDYIRYYVGNQAAVIMGVGWYKLNTATNIYERIGGHFFNIYGYDYDLAWQQDKVIIKSVNSWIDYTGRSAENMYDDVVMTKITNPANYPDGLAYTLSGPGFTFNDFKAVAEDIFVMLPFP